MAKVLLIEAFDGGSHRQLMDLLASETPDCVRHGLPAKKWHWKARTAALYFADTVPSLETYRTLFTSSTLNLAELVALRPDLQKLKKIVYFHENQLVYPVRKQQERDFQFGYNQILSCLVADVVAFNSCFNRDSFLSSIDSFVKLIPDHRPKGLVEKIRPKSIVIYYPMQFDKINVRHKEPTTKDATIHVGPDPGRRWVHFVWPHRWEHDKNPELFFATLYRLADEGYKFKVSVLGQTYTDVPEMFAEARTRLEQFITNWGFVEDKDEYYLVLSQADVVVSTAEHEFFGVAMIEAVFCGCRPIAPNKLVYPEIFPKDCLYNTPQQLYKMLKRCCQFPDEKSVGRTQLNLDTYSWKMLKASYQNVLDAPL